MNLHITTPSNYLKNSYLKANKYTEITNLSLCLHRTQTFCAHPFNQLGDNSLGACSIFHKNQSCVIVICERKGSMHFLKKTENNQTTK